MAIESRVDNRAGNEGNLEIDEDMESEGPSGTNIRKKEAHVRATYHLNSQCGNYDANAAAHRIADHTLMS